MRNIVVVVMLLVSGCGETGSDAPSDSNTGTDPDGGSGSGDSTWYKSGSRIKMRVLNTPDGAKQFQGWRDTMRDEDCAFYAASDSTSRCLPTDSVYLTEQGNYYSDAACTVRVVAVTACPTPAKYVTLTTFDSCAFTYGPVHMRGAVVSAPYIKSGASCTPVTPNASIVVYALGAVVPLTDFQSATVAVE